MESLIQYLISLDHPRQELTILLWGYLLGSIPFGYIIVRLKTGQDIRLQGSRNIGATNGLRVAGAFVGLLIFLCDAVKGAIAIGAVDSISMGASIIAATGAIFGHLFPVWLGFKGGKGIATYVGIMCVMQPWVGALCILTWWCVAYVTCISSLSALIMLCLSPVYALLYQEPYYSGWAFCIGMLLMWRHQDNIKRLIAGQEPTFEIFKKHPVTPTVYKQAANTSVDTSSDAQGMFFEKDNDSMIGRVHHDVQ